MGCAWVVGVPTDRAAARCSNVPSPVCQLVSSIVQQALRAGPVDELQIHVAPVILGAGRTLFGELGTRLHLVPSRVLDSPYATHIRYRVAS